MVPRRSEIAKEQERVQAIANQLWHDNSLPKRPEGALWTHRYIQATQYGPTIFLYPISKIKFIIFMDNPYMVMTNSKIFRLNKLIHNMLLYRQINYQLDIRYLRRKAFLVSWYTMRTNLLNWCNLVSISKNVMFYAFLLARIYKIFITCSRHQSLQIFEFQFSKSLFFIY